MEIKEILNLLVTDRDRQELLLFLEDLKKNAFEKDGQLDKMTDNNVKFGPIFKTVFKNNSLQQDKDSLSKFLSDVIRKLKEIETINLVIAIHPTARILEALSSWTSKVFSKKVLVDIHVNPEIIGGAVLIIDGKYKDYSLLKMLNEASKTRRAEIVSLINK
jgi:F0F1-type ATP synthase delta subunit